MEFCGVTNCGSGWRKEICGVTNCGSGWRKGGREDVVDECLEFVTVINKDNKDLTTRGSCSAAAQKALTPSLSQLVNFSG